MDAKTERQNNPDVETLASGAGNHLERYVAHGTTNYHLSVADLHSKILDACPLPGGPNSFNFVQFLGNFGKIVCWPPPPRRNPRSTTVYLFQTEVECDLSHKLSINLQYHLKVIRQFTFFIASFVSKKALPPNSYN